MCFARTRLIPTYIYGFCAGPYKEIKGKNTYNNIPMSVFSRTSLFEHLEKWAEFMFETTNGAMKVNIIIVFFNYFFRFMKNFSGLIIPLANMTKFFVLNLM